MENYMLYFGDWFDTGDKEVDEWLYQVVKGIVLIGIIGLLFMYSMTASAFDPDCPNGYEIGNQVITVNGSTTEKLVCVEVIPELFARYDQLTETLLVQSISIFNGAEDLESNVHTAVLKWEEPKGCFDIIKLVE